MAGSSRGHGEGDALARLRVRWEEVAEAFTLVRRAAAELALSPERILPPPQRPVPVPDGRAVGWAEAPQGEVLYLLELDSQARISYCAPRSASFHNLVLFSSTFVGDILTDFPFNEASFGLSIAGVVM